MANTILVRRVWSIGLLLVLGLATVVFAQLGAAKRPGDGERPIQEYTSQEVQANGLVDTLNELGKQNWDVFQVVPIWKFQDLGGGAELVATRYQILGRRPKVDGK